MPDAGAPPESLSPSRLQIKPGTGSNCLGRMTAKPFGSSDRGGPVAERPAKVNRAAAEPSRGDAVIPQRKA